MNFLSLLLPFMIPLALAAEDFTNVIITYPSDTPTDVINQAMRDIVNAGGTISHEFYLFKGFSAEAPVQALHSLSTQSTKYKPTIEEDEIVTVYNGQD